MLVIEARDLKYKSGDVGAINPFCEVALMPFDLKQRTSLKTNTFNARFDETLRFNFKIADTQELKIGRIKICMFHYGKISQVFLGSFIIGMEELYLKPGHEMFRKWIALSDINADSVVRGYLKVSKFLSFVLYFRLVHSYWGQTMFKLVILKMKLKAMWLRIVSILKK